jgi:hypothetical protein
MWDQYVAIYITKGLEKYVFEPQTPIHISIWSLSANMETIWNKYDTISSNDLNVE